MVIRVGTWTLDSRTRFKMNCSKEGRNLSPDATGGGVLGGVTGNLALGRFWYEGMLCGGGGIILSSHRMTSRAARARYSTMWLRTGV